MTIMYGGKESKMKNKFIRKWLVILTVAAMMIPAGIPANAETVEEGENIAPTAGISAETPNVTAETQKEEISAEMPDMTAETQNEEKSDVQAEGQNQAKQGVLEAVRQNTEKAEEASDAVDVQAEERTAGEVQIGEQIYPTLTEAFAAAKRRGRTAAFRKCRSFTTDLADKECDVRYKWIYCIGGSRIQRQFYVYESGNIQYCRKRKD